MDLSAPVILSICAISLVVIACILLAAILLLRVTKSSIFGFGMMLMRMLNDPKPEDDPVVIPRQRHGSVNLRAEAESVDFDAAVARYNSQTTAQTAPPPVFPPPVQPPAAFSAPPPQQTGYPQQYNTPPVYPAQSAPQGYPPPQQPPAYPAQAAPPGYQQQYTPPPAPFPAYQPHSAEPPPPLDPPSPFNDDANTSPSLRDRRRQRRRRDDREDDIDFLDDLIGRD
jgi:hypothetical protein